MAEKLNLSPRRLRLGKGVEARFLGSMCTKRQSPLVEQSLLTFFTNAGYDLDVWRDNKSVFDPDDLFPALNRYAAPITENYDEEIMEKAKAWTMKVFARPRDDIKVKPYRLDSKLRALVHEDKSSGLPFLLDKGEVFTADLDIAKKVLLGDRAPQPCMAYHRIQHGKEGPKTRLVWGYPQSMTLIECKFSRILIEKFKARRTPYLIGLRKFEIPSRLLSAEEAPFRYALDYSKFDSTVSAKMIDFAFGVLKTYFVMDAEDEWAWRKVINYFIHTPIAMPDVQVYTKHRGIPSGSEFTQLIGSIINVLILQYCMFKLSGKPISDRSLVVLGDDSAFGFDRWYSIEQIAVVAKELGINIGVDKSFSSRRKKDPIPFLGHYWVTGLADRDSIEIVKRIVFPERLSGISDPRTRIGTRVFSYLADAISATKVVRQWSRYQGPEMRRFYHQKIGDEAVTGYQLYLRDVLHEDVSHGGVAYKLGNIGLLL